MTMAGLSVVERVFERFEWYCRREEEKRKKKGRIAWRLKKNVRRVKNKHSVRIVEV
jgi:hypothetical protein